MPFDQDSKREIIYEAETIAAALPEGDPLRQACERVSAKMAANREPFLMDWAELLLAVRGKLSPMLVLPRP